ncbi:twin-arginine translocation signal domain-containing protein [Streptomyces bacillaris]|uniref:twin-arginine translocation signal domain-containing protein n=1 Tax=Streptomyces bacillaris TaxID=68179 RepID=UPI003351AE90
MTASPVSRRKFLARAAVITAATASMSLPGSQFLASPAHAVDQDPFSEVVRRAVKRAQARNKRVLDDSRSTNGWEIERTADQDGSIFTRPVPGVPLAGVQVRLGPAEDVLVHVIQRFHYEIDELREGDVVGWRAPDHVPTNRPESALASGTGVQIRSNFYPVGARGGYFPHQVMVVRDILAELNGVIRWGGDDRTPDESLFYIAVKPNDARLTKTAQAVRTWQATPGRGAGTPVDILAADRREAAHALEERHRRAA